MTNAALRFKLPGRRLAWWVASASVTLPFLLLVYVFAFDRPSWLLVSALGMLGSGSGIGAWQRLFMYTEIRPGVVEIRDGGFRRREFHHADIADVSPGFVDGSVTLALRSGGPVLLPGVRNRDLAEIHRVLGA